jgi:hypothetical protein
VYLWEGQGRILVNKKPVDDYFRDLVWRSALLQPLLLTNTVGKVDIVVQVGGWVGGWLGGHLGWEGWGEGCSGLGAVDSSSQKQQLKWWLVGLDGVRQGDNLEHRGLVVN